MKPFATRRHLLFVGVILSFSLIALALLPRPDFNLPGLIGPTRNWARGAVSNTGSAAGKMVARWDRFRGNYRM
jgi:hypothetical protein